MGIEGMPAQYASGVARREEILDAASALFTEVGFTGVSLRDIASRVGISHPGLLRHFASKDAILLAVLDRYEGANAAWLEPGHIEAFAAMSGEATSLVHPAHDRFAARYRLQRGVTAGRFALEKTAGSIVFDITPRDEGIRLTAAWTGLQLQWLYDRETIDLVGSLNAHHAWLAGSPQEPARRAAAPPGGQAAETPQAVVGYAPGRIRRTRIIDDAMALFASGGFYGTSLRSIAEMVGISKSTLLHHFASKEELLIAALQRRDEVFTATRPSWDEPAIDHLRYVIATARSRSAHPGIAELYCVLASEGSRPGHPAHEFFRERFRISRAYGTHVFTKLRDEGMFPANLDPERESTWFLALWDGLQFQWLYDPTAFDIADQLQAHADQLLTPA
ncbi:MAG TPA: TetR/AcrR family transcriptional regulator [Microbacteriaceae bacterium]|jgi:AcrR family transcriptional regulator|nr:TetR/AcrR family transcriptional regulator [Microbacteriaceae bacterium]